MLRKDGAELCGVGQLLGFALPLCRAGPNALLVAATNAATGHQVSAETTPCCNAPPSCDVYAASPPAGRSCGRVHLFPLPGLAVVGNQRATPCSWTQLPSSWVGGVWQLQY